ncbi:MAG: diguanylate cyclase, partial [Deltaproteobacteria bacterium]
EKQLLRLLAGPAATAIGNARLFRQQQEQARRLGTLLDASRTLTASVHLDEVLAGVARLAAEAAGATYATVYEYRPHHDAIVYRAGHSLGLTPEGVHDDALGTEYALSDFPGERAILGASEAVLEQLSATALSDDRRRSMEAWKQKTCLSLPLRAGGAPQGILRLTMTDAERRFTAPELELLAALAESAGAAIHNARLFRAQEEESERLLELLEVSRRLTATFDRREVVSALREGAARLLAGGTTAGVWLSGAGGLTSATEPADGAAAGELAQEALAGSRTVDRVGAEWSGMAVPLAVKDRVEGVLVVAAGGHRRFAEGEREALQVLANQAAAALENERLYRRAEQEAIRDGLTGLYNHRHFQERLRQECRRAQRYGTPLSLLMLDLDDFKEFNDRFGHQIGDEALREVGQILFAVTRRGVDLAARYGGEEFAVILPHTRAADLPVHGAAAGGDDPEAPPPAGAGALIVAERVRAAIAGHAFPGHGGRRYARTTVTVGVADLRDGDDAASLIAAADAVLYEGKRSGRDQVVARGA